LLNILEIKGDIIQRDIKLASWGILPELVRLSISNENLNVRPHEILADSKKIVRNSKDTNQKEKRQDKHYI
jgi:hypothetical protein